AELRRPDRPRADWRPKGLGPGLRDGPGPPRPRRAAAARFRPAAPERSRGDAPPLRRDNGYGGFTPDGTEYVIRLGPRQPPLPWINVVANPGFGLLARETGRGWAGGRSRHAPRR